ncbi:MAG: hypothetical protein KBS73_04180 [Bacteroidales bacterium]|nr:hypothetical protein [Candidatus Cacconaster equifaecalis]
MKRTLHIIFAVLLALQCISADAMPVASGSRPGNWIQKKTYTSADGSTSFDDLTYYDGHGYPVQTVAGKAGGTASAPNIVTPIVYDNMRRDDATAYLPYASAEGLDAQVADVVTKQAQFYSSLYSGETRAYAGKVYETSPVGRPLSATREGRLWNGHSALMEYDVNGSGDAVMKLSFNHSQQKVQRTGTYSPGTLIKTTSTDEDGRRSVVFTDIWGKTICSRQFPDDGTIIETSYVYDLKDSLVCVIQPKGMESLRSNPSITEIVLDGTFARANCFSYIRDALGRVRRSVVPGGAVTEYVYDQRNRIRMMSTEGMIDGVTARRFLMMNYDDYDRLVMRGYVKCTQQVTSQTLNAVDISSIPANTMLRVLYNASYYPFSDGSQSISGLPFQADEVAPSSQLSTTGHRGLLMSETIADVNGIGGSYSTAGVTRSRAYYYDGKGRVIQIRESDSDGFTATYSTAYDFAGNVTATLEKHTSPGSVTHTLKTVYTLDARGRVTACARTFDGNSLQGITYSYDTLGRLAQKQGGSSLSETYGYDLHGWTSGIEASRGGGTLFSEHIRYNNPQKPDAVALYSGNISEIESSQYGATGNVYSYSYDGASRLVDARHFTEGSASISDKNTERSITYDSNGNVLSLTRFGQSQNDRDQIGFSYTGNRMTGAVESVGQDSYTFAYDADGNRTVDSRTCLEFSYNILNLPFEVKDGQGNMEMCCTYLSDGTKVSAVNADGDGLLYRGNFVYSKSGQSVTLESAAWDEGRIAASGNTCQDQWHVKDHLGNVRSVINLSAGQSASTASVILEQNDYLPYGTKASDSSRPSLATNRYRYAGKEEQRVGSFDSRLLDFGARSYDPWSCQWTSVDPMAGKYLSLSPYAYCGNDPILFVDENGNEWKKKNGEVITDLSKVRIYIFYTDDFQNQAIVKYNKAVRKYGDDAVALSNTGKAIGFKEDWENMSGNISDVYILVHGKNQSMNFANDGSSSEQITSTGTGKTNLSQKSAIDINEIKIPIGNISNATLHINSCHSMDPIREAHGSGIHAQGAMVGKETVGHAFFSNFQFKKVIGAKGAFNYYPIVFWDKPKTKVILER